MVQEAALTALASIADSSQVLYLANLLRCNYNVFMCYT